MHTPERKLADTRDALRTLYNDLNSLPLNDASPATRETRLSLYQDAHNIVDDISGLLTVRSKPAKPIKAPVVVVRTVLPLTWPTNQSRS